jgi:hypothetical protein
MASVTEADQGLGQRDYSTSPDKYISLDNLVDGTKEDVRDIYAAIYGDQGLSGLVEIIGAKKSAGTADETVWYEEGRLGRSFETGSTAGKIETVDGVANATADETDVVRVNDVVLNADNKRFLITSVAADAVKGKDLSTANAAEAALPASKKYSVIGNAYAQGTNQPTKPFSPRLTRRRNPFTIVKESFHVTGSQASNVGYVNVGGQNMWYLKGELDARRKFLNMREAMLVFSQNEGTSGAGFNSDGTGTGGTAVPTSEGFFDAVEDRGTVGTGVFDVAMDGTGGFDEVIIAIDKQGAPLENALYLNKANMVKLDNLLGTAGLGGDGVGAMSAFGAFNNNRDMAIQMGFQSFTKGGYTFHKHDWKLLNDPVMGGVSSYKGGLIPLSQIVDMKTGNRHHSLEMNYKAAGNYSRELEHWVEGGGVLGFNTGGEDLAKFNYRSECNLCVRGANQFVAFK